MNKSKSLPATRVTEAQLKAYKAAAEKAKREMADWVRVTLDEAAEKSVHAVKESRKALGKK